MRAFVITGPGKAEVAATWTPPVARPGRGGRRRRAGRGVRHRRGVLHRRDGLPAHRRGGLPGADRATSGAGVVTAVGDGRRPGLARPAGHRRHDARLRALRPLRAGRQHLCADRYEIGIRRRLAGRARRAAAGARRRALHELPAGLDADAGRAGRAGRQRAARVRAAALPPATGCWSSAPARSACSPRMFARARGAEVHLLGLPRRTWSFARRWASADAWTAGHPAGAALGRASSTPPTGAGLPALALDLVEPGGRVVYIGLAERPAWSTPGSSRSRTSPRSASSAARPAWPATIAAYASGAVDPAPAGRRHGRPRRGRRRPGRRAERPAPLPRSTWSHGDDRPVRPGSRGARHGTDPGERPARAWPTTPRTTCSPRRPSSPRATPTQVAALLRGGRRRTACALTFRSGGTSLSGQAVTDGVLVDTRRHFRDIEVLDGGARVRVQPGATVRQVNARLAPLRPQARPRPGQRVGVHHRRRRRQQLQRHGLRHPRQHLPHAGVAGAGAAQRHGDRHRRRRRRRPAARAGARAVRRAWTGCATGSAATRTRCAGSARSSR